MITYILDEWSEDYRNGKTEVKRTVERLNGTAESMESEAAIDSAVFAYMYVYAHICVYAKG